MMDPKKLSKLIREKKRKMMEAEPELSDTDSRPDMNPNDLQMLDRTAQIEHSVDAPEKHSSEMDQPEGDEMLEMGLSSEEKGRMGRLRKYFDSLD